MAQNKLVYQGNCQVQTDDPKKPQTVGKISLYEVNSSSEKAPVLSGEVRVRDRIYRVALWKATPVKGE